MPRRRRRMLTARLARDADVVVAHTHTFMSPISAARAARASSYGSRAHHELEQLLATATLLLQPSFAEGLGLPVAEAIAAGIPVAVSTGGALPEIVRGIRAELFAPRAVDAITHALDLVAATPDTPLTPDSPHPRAYSASVLSAIDRAQQLA